MANSLEHLCEACKVGYHAPFDRFEKLAVEEKGPAFLMRCKYCGALWYEGLHSADRISASEAHRIFPKADL